MIELAVFALGAAVGSFLNVCIYRLPEEGVSVTSPAFSRCPSCEAPIRWYDNIPILSYIVLLGRCRQCATRISPRYPLVEALTGTAALAAFETFAPQVWPHTFSDLLVPAGALIAVCALTVAMIALLRQRWDDGRAPQHPWIAVLLTLTLIVGAAVLTHRTLPPSHFAFLTPFVCFAFLAALIVITFVDIDHQIIPDDISLPGICIGFVAALLLGQPSWRDSLIGILAGGGFLWALAEGYFRLTGRDGMGGGDIKLLAMIGAFLGWRALPVTLMIASITGTAIGVGYILASGGDRRLAIPFGPFLAAGAVAALFAGNELTQWYFEALQP